LPAIGTDSFDALQIAPTDPLVKHVKPFRISDPPRYTDAW
jgi:hypothetical protein